MSTSRRNSKDNLSLPTPSAPTATPASSLSSLPSPTVKQENNDDKIATLISMMSNIHTDMQSMKAQINQREIADPSLSSASQSSSSSTAHVTHGASATPAAAAATSSTQMKKEERLAKMKAILQSNDMNKELLGLSNNDRIAFLAHLDAEGDSDDDSAHSDNEQKVNTHKHNYNPSSNILSSSSSSFPPSSSQFNSALFPLDVNEQLPMSELLEKALEFKNKKRRFNDVDHMFTLLVDQFNSLSGAAAKAFFNYMLHVIKLSVSHGLHAASYYHFAVFKKIKDKHYDLTVNGPIDMLVMQEIYCYFNPIGADRWKSFYTTAGNTKFSFNSKSKNAKSNGGYRGSKHSYKQNKFTGADHCPVHPNGNHSKKDCNVLNAQNKPPAK